MEHYRASRLAIILIVGAVGLGLVGGVPKDTAAQTPGEAAVTGKKVAEPGTLTSDPVGNGRRRRAGDTLRQQRGSRCE